MILKRQGKQTVEDKEKELLKAREKQRKKMIRTRFGQKPKKHAKKGIESCMMAVLGLLLFVLLISRSFSVKGQVSILSGLAGIMVLAIAIRGVSYAMKGFRERDKNYITCKIGVGGNGLLLFCMCAIFIRGLF